MSTRPLLDSTCTSDFLTASYEVRILLPWRVLAIRTAVNGPDDVGTIYIRLGHVLDETYRRRPKSNLLNATNKPVMSLRSMAPKTWHATSFGKVCRVTPKTRQREILYPVGLAASCLLLVSTINGKAVTYWDVDVFSELLSKSNPTKSGTFDI